METTEGSAHSAGKILRFSWSGKPWRSTIRKQGILKGHMISKETCIDTLVSYAEKSGILISERQGSLLYDHVQLMLQWNRRLNLTRITDPDQILVKHVLDSILPARWLPRTGYALDVGSGPGFPGIPLGILNPALKMVLLDARRKKTSFLKVVVSELGLVHIRPIQGRWEDLEDLQQGLTIRSFDLITMRAFRLERKHLTRLGKALGRGGFFAWWAGPSAHIPMGTGLSLSRMEEEDMAFQADYTYSLPGMSDKRRILIWQRLS